MTDHQAKVATSVALMSKGYDYGVFRYDNFFGKWRRIATTGYYFEAVDVLRFYCSMHEREHLFVMIVDYYTRRNVHGNIKPCDLDLPHSFSHAEFRWHDESDAAVKRHGPEFYSLNQVLAATFGHD